MAAVAPPRGPGSSGPPSRVLPAQRQGSSAGPARVSYFGIRHHGPGSAAALVAALDELRPVQVLIEGPADATDVLPMLADPAMKPPVALLAYPPDDPARTAFWPYAEFSPEYQATCWAVRHSVPVAFIDLPSTAHFEERVSSEPPDSSGGGLGGSSGHESSGGEPSGSSDHGSYDGEPSGSSGQGSSGGEPSGGSYADESSGPPDRESSGPADRQRRSTDPIAVLAEAAGYEDGESWWADIVEQNPAPGPVFAAIATAMGEVRADELDAPEPFEARREAHMRLAIADCAKTATGPVAVVCGAWHVPALTAKHTRAEDRATLGALPRKKAQLTWAPWTSPRLAMAVGYGAGVAAPGWCQHLWRTRDRDRTDATSTWLARIARVLRARGHLVSTAALIEAQRLAVALACLRGRPQPGFEELREACVACLFGGETLLWRLVEDELLLGNDVGEIPPGVPLAPLIEDFQIQTRAARLKPEALERELSVDLRSESGLFRSTLLHRLAILDVPWGRLTDAGRTRGTFREKWVLAFDPAHTVGLVEKLVYGPTIEQAASGVLAEQFTKATTLGTLAAGIRDALTASLPAAVDHGLGLLQQRAALSSDCADILTTLPPLADILRYGQARATDLTALAGLGDHLIAEAGVNLKYAARTLDADGAEHLSGLIAAADAAVRLIQPAPDVADAWRGGLRAVLDDKQATPRVAGCVASLLYDAGDLGADAAVAVLSLRLSPGTPVADAAGFLEGFFASAARRLIYDDGLRAATDRWLTGLPDEDFVAYLPLMRRVLSTLDPMERKRLMAAIQGKRAHLPSGLAMAPDGGQGWARHFAVIAGILAPELRASPSTGQGQRLPEPGSPGYLSDVSALSTQVRLSIQEPGSPGYLSDISAPDHPAGGER